MLTSRGGCATGVREIWVNGKRIRLTLLPTPMVRERARVGAPVNARFGYVPLVVLSEIAPEHIQELVYHDCFDTSVAAVGSNDAIFVDAQARRDVRAGRRQLRDRAARRPSQRP